MTLPLVADGGLAGELATRREHLARAALGQRDERLVALLCEVDRALDSLSATYDGVCRACHEPLPEGQRAAFPTVTVCLGCLTPEERAALEHELANASRVQAGLLPPAAWTGGEWEVAYHWEPRGAVSGDHVDLLPACHRDLPTRLLIGDVVGKGVGASLLQSQIHALWRGFEGQRGNLADLVGRTNGHLAAVTRAASYATLVGLELGAEGVVELVNAGHPRPLLADRRGVRPLEGADLPLGLFGDAAFAPRALYLSPGDTLLLYTDGWTEAASGGEEYGIGRAAAALRRASRLPLGDLLAACRADLGAFLDGASPGDDLTLVAVRRRSAAALDAERATGQRRAG